MKGSVSVATTVDLTSLVEGNERDPHRVLGPHGDVVRAWRPDAAEVELVLPDGKRIPMEQEHPAGVFVAKGVELPAEGEADYRFDVTYPSGDQWLVDDPYRFWPTLGDVDLYLLGEGRHERLWHRLGARVVEHQGVTGTAFAVWAPAARSVRVVGDCNSWDGRQHPMRSIGSSGVWELFIPGIGHGSRYKYEILTPAGHLTLKADPLATATEPPPATASVVFQSSYEWGDDEWVRDRRSTNPWTAPMSVYECHIGSWRHVPEEGDRPLTYRELAEQLPAYLTEMGFTHVEFLPVAEHPFGGSWGYQVTAYYAPTARFGTPDDFRFLVDALHQAGIGVIVDWVPAHFPKDSFALARFDGTALYEHADPRQGEHPDWGTLVFNFGRHEVSNFLLANALYWIEELHVDGLRVDAVASMLYLDYSRNEGEWVPNKFGGRENLEAVEFLRQLNTVVHAEHPGVMTIAEESTSWPGVSRPVYLGGLGFGFKWNMGWMHDTLTYFSKEPVHRRHHHSQLTFGLLYAFSENFCLPISHDEVVHGKGSLINKMPGDKGAKVANLRALLAWMWAHPGKQLLFMGCEIGQEREWSHDRSLDWDLLGDPSHRGIQELVREMNRIYRDEPALWEKDLSDSGFEWIDANDADQNVLSFVRYSADRSRSLACIANLSGIDRPSYRIGVPKQGAWNVVLDTTMANAGYRSSEPTPWHGFDQSLTIDVPSLGVVWLVNG
jgi:1,4-alpha-glucan branching enzyme